MFGYACQKHKPPLSPAKLAVHGNSRRCFEIIYAINDAIYAHYTHERRNKSTYTT